METGEDGAEPEEDNNIELVRKTLVSDHAEKGKVSTFRYI